MSSVLPSSASTIRSTSEPSAKKDLTGIDATRGDLIPPDATANFGHLMASAIGMFEQPRLDELVIRQHSPAPVGSSILDPLAATESLAIEFLAKGGKYARPFITLAAYDAMTGGHAATLHGHAAIERIPLSVFRCALSIEMFHKASLVHDDIEDDDMFRYGIDTMHRRFGLPTAINVGDYMIGLGYRLVTREASELGAATASDILEGLASAHIRLAEGQGAELFWRDRLDKRLSIDDALQIYALKTAPAFEAALYTGIRLAGDASVYRASMASFARAIGIGFQILNDLNDWSDDPRNKRMVAGDVLGGRPTLLLALALDSLDPPAQSRLLSILETTDEQSESARVVVARGLFEQARVFEQAYAIVEGERRQALDIIQRIPSEALKRLMVYLVDMVLHPSPSPQNAT